MQHAIIFANGELKDAPSLLRDIHPGDLIIAADGGFNHCQRLGIKPDVVIGDFDSLQPEDLTTLQAQGVQLIQYPSRKDETDLELALHYALQQDRQQVIVIGALGARWDMTIANLLLAAYSPFSSLQVRLVDEHQELTLLRGGQSIVLSGNPGDTLSLIPLTSQATGITTQGLEYALENEDLVFGSPRGVSNMFIADHARITLTSGLLICVVIRDGGMK